MKSAAFHERPLARDCNPMFVVLNNESVEYTEEYNPSDILGALRMKRWHISSDQQVGSFGYI